MRESSVHVRSTPANTSLLKITWSCFQFVLKFCLLMTSTNFNRGGVGQLLHPHLKKHISHFHFLSFFISLFFAVTCTTSTTISSCWPTCFSMSARQSTQCSTIWCQLPIARSSSPHCSTSFCLSATQPGGSNTPWPATPLAFLATTPSLPTSSKKQHIEKHNTLEPYVVVLCLQQKHLVNIQ